MVELKDGTLELTRGTVVSVRNENASGHVVNGIHPAVVIQNDISSRIRICALRIMPRRSSTSCCSAMESVLALR